MQSSPQLPSARTRLIQEAWIGDAVLCLFARSKILTEDGVLDGEKCVRMTSNRFLGTLGEPTKVEAEVGRRYLDGGLVAAFHWIEQNIIPMFNRQEENRLKRPGRSR